MKNEFYAYQEALDIIESFMDASGIRYFCTVTCQGGCCSSCKLKNCSDNRNLACSYFICNSLGRLILKDKFEDYKNHRKQLLKVLLLEPIVYVIL